MVDRSDVGYGVNFVLTLSCWVGFLFCLTLLKSSVDLEWKVNISLFRIDNDSLFALQRAVMRMIRSFIEAINSYNKRRNQKNVNSSFSRHFLTKCLGMCVHVKADDNHKPSRLEI